MNDKEERNEEVEDSWIINLIARTHILKELSVYTSDPVEKSELELMSGTTAEGKQLYQSWVVDSCRHITHILEDMKTCKPPIDHILELLPRLQPRFYSIASSAKVTSQIQTLT